VHVSNPLYDLTGSTLPEQGWPLRNVLQRVADAGSGVVVILCNQFETSDLIAQAQSYSQQQKHGERPAKPKMEDLYTIGLGAQILSEVGVRKMRVLSAPKRIHALSGFGLEVVEYVS